MAIASIILAAVVGFALRLLKFGPMKAWLSGCAIVPVFVLVAEFILPYQGGGASMWPVALVVGGAFGAAASGLGVFVAGLITRTTSDDA